MRLAGDLITPKKAEPRTHAEGRGGSRAYEV